MSIKHVSIFTFFFLFLIPATFSLSFNLSTIGTQSRGSINVSGNANISNQGIQVTPDRINMTLGSNLAGRAVYSEPLHLGDKASASLTDFSTHFSFVIDSDGDLKYADGLTFFLAPLGSTIKNWSYGSGLGIGRSDSPAHPSLESFVAVEFDTYPNDWDPSSPHVGININTMKSVTTAEWNNNITDGVQNDAWISYKASSYMLRVDFTGYSSNRTQRGNLSYAVDLRDYLPEYVTFGFSASTGAFFQKNSVKSWDFNSSLQLNVSPKEPSPSPAPEPVKAAGGKDSKENKKGLIVGLSVGLSILILASASASYAFCKKKYKKESGFEDFFDEFEGTGPKRFPYSELVLATKNFAEEEQLGEGGFGGVYRGLLRGTNSYIAVKRVSKGSKQGPKEYASEVKIISQLRHRNLVQLIGWCHERGELILVYEFMPNGSLDSHLYKAKSVLTWKVRCQIAQGLASALLYLHEEWERCVVHRDIKPSNIMLDSNFNAKLGDFGLARFVDHEKGSQTTVLAGTIGYMAAECAVTGRASKESDIYSFGIVLLEIACGRRPIDCRCQENQVILVEWVWSLYGTGQLLDAADPKLESEYDVREIEQLMVVGLWCAHPDSSQRPSIRQVIQVLNSEAQLPTLPSMMPVATYNTPKITRVSKSSNANSGGEISESVTYGYYSNSSRVTTSSADFSTTVLSGR